jgi:hypothetical protein
MAKYEQPFEDTQEMYNRAIDATSLNQYMNITILVNNKAKDIFKVAKCSETENFKTKDDINIFINEKLLEGLTPEQRIIVVEESIAAIHFDTESDTITLTKPDVSTFSGILRKYTFETWNVIRESIKTLKTKEKEAEDQRKAQVSKAKADKAKKFVK